MHEQLFLLRTDEHAWRLDDHTREIGRQGLLAARAALRQASTDDRPADERGGRPDRGSPGRRAPDGRLPARRAPDSRAPDSRTPRRAAA